MLYNTDKAKGPRRINLDDRASTKEYTPPTSLKIHLSKIPVPELRPKAEITPTKSRVPSSSSRPPALLPDKSKERGNGTKEPKFDRAKEHEKERLRLFEQAREERAKAERAKRKDKKDKRSDKVKERERLKEEEKERQREKEAEKEREKARKIAEKEAKRKDKDKDKDKKGTFHDSTIGFFSYFFKVRHRIPTPASYQGLLIQAKIDPLHIMNLYVPTPIGHPRLLHSLSRTHRSMEDTVSLLQVFRYIIYRLLYTLARDRVLRAFTGVDRDTIVCLLVVGLGTVLGTSGRVSLAFVV